MLIIILNIHTQVGKVTKDTCGGATYKAGKSDALAIKELSETGFVFCTCRHGYLLRAVDMVKAIHIATLTIFMTTPIELDVILYAMTWYENIGHLQKIYQMRLRNSKPTQQR
jgi:hypothetical protein